METQLLVTSVRENNGALVVERRLFFLSESELVEFRKKTNWVKDEKGRFAGSVPTGGSGGNSGLTNAEEDDIIKEIKSAGICGEIHVPPKQIETDTLSFDKTHVAERARNISENQAKSFIKNSSVSVSRWNGRFENYFSSDGAAYVDKEIKSIRTAFSSKEYDEATRSMMEVLKKHGK